MWFNTDEDDMEDGEAVVSPSDKTKNDDDIMDPISKFMERKKCMLKNWARRNSGFPTPGLFCISWQNGEYLPCHDLDFRDFFAF